MPIREIQNKIFGSFDSKVLNEESKQEKDTSEDTV